MQWDITDKINTHMNLNVQQKKSILDVDNKSLISGEQTMLEISSEKKKLKAKLTISFTAKKKMNSMF